MLTLRRTITLVLAAPLSLVAIGCGDDTDDHGRDPANESEQITRVELTFTPEAGGDPVVAAFDDRDGEGGVSGTTDPITLAAGTAYAVTVTFTNGLENPPEEITEEIQDEAEEHQIFFGGDAVGGLLTHAYTDVESAYGDNAVGDDLPVGLSNTITASAAGKGSLIVQLQHLPDVNGEAVKVAGLAEMFPTLPGEPDVSVTFAVAVQ